MMRRVSLERLREDRGAALVTVMLLVSIMAAGMAISFDALGFMTKRHTASRMFEQARYYALGGEQLALTAAEKLWKAKARLEEAKVVSYPIDGGQIEGVISDASNCFNVNSLVSKTGSVGYKADERAMAQYSRLLLHLGFAEREAVGLTGALVDWIDSDTRPVLQGAEDYDYAALDTPYRTANTLVRDLTELRLVKGYTPEVLARVGAHLCARDNTADTVLNVNVLRLADAPLLAAILGPNVSLEFASRLIATRPSGGYSDIADFYFERAFEGKAVEQDIRAQTAVKPQRVVSQVRVRFHDGVSRLTSEIWLNDDGAAHVASHRFGVFQ